METKKLHIGKISPIWITGAVATIIIAGIVFYGWKQLSTIKAQQNELAITNESLVLKIDELNTNLSNTQQNMAQIFLDLNKSQENTNLTLAEQLEKITGTVNTLEQLTTLDEELLKKYSKVFFLNEHYAPTDIVKIDPDYLFEPSRGLEIHGEVWPFLKDMIDDANDDDGNLFVGSAFRSFGTQTVLKDNYTVVYGAGSANQFSADQGYSEHQLGTTVDLTTKALNGSLNGFDKTPEYKWLLENAHKYGFILSYPSGNSYYKFEPWHWRFVGIDLATKLHNEDKNFYEEDQRVIDSYLGVMFKK